MKLKDSVVLGGMFLFLLVFYILQKTIFKPDENSFRTELTAFDPAQIDKIKYIQNDQNFEIYRHDSGWKVSDGKLVIDAKKASVDHLLTLLSNLKTVQLVSRDSSKWAEYEIDQNKGIQYSFYEGDLLKADIIIGRFDFDQQNQSAVSYIRLANENEIYSVDGFVSREASRDFNSYRENKLLSFDPQIIEKLTLVSGDLVENLEKTADGQWLFGNKRIASVSVVNYLTKIANLTGKEFTDDFIPGTGFGVIQSLELNDSLNLQAYLFPTGGFVIQTSQNEAYFRSDSTGLYKQVFMDFEDILSGKI